jgi:hypothetical protein
VFSTSNGCRSHRSERVLGSAIDTLIKKYGYSREEFLIITKLDNLSDDAISKTPFRLVVEDIIRDGVMKSADVMKTIPYCIHPDMLKYQINKSLANLNLNTIDVFLLEDPHTKLPLEYDKKETEYRIYRAFEFLEESIISNKIKSYGISNRLGKKLSKMKQINLNNIKEKSFEELKRMNREIYEFPFDRIVKIAEEVGGKHHGFRFISSEYTPQNMEALFNKRYRQNKIGKITKLYKNEKLEKLPRGCRHVSLMDF